LFFNGTLNKKEFILIYVHVEFKSILLYCSFWVFLKVLHLAGARFCEGGAAEVVVHQIHKLLGVPFN
jgi:hypothetical protein